MSKTVFRAWAGGLLLAFGVLGLFSVCQAETGKLKFMPETPKESEAKGKKYPRGFLLTGSPQHIEFNTNSTPQSPDASSKDETLKQFQKLVKKEPTYTSKKPLKGVIRFGGKQLAFVLDAVPEKKGKDKPDDKGEPKEKTEKQKESTDDKETTQEKEKTPMFNRLYVDRNANGDLTDDEPIDAKSVNRYSTNYGRATFQFSLPVEHNGTKSEATCDFGVSINNWSHTITGPDGKEKVIEQQHCYASFSTSSFREGEITLGDKKYRVILMDFNNNGLFDDTFQDPKIDAQNSGDAFYICPADDKSPEFSWIGMSANENAIEPLYVGSVVGLLDGKFWNLEVTPSGESFTLTPYAGDLGTVEKPGKQFTLTTYHKTLKSLVSIRSNKDGKASLPVGVWDLFVYQMTFEKEKPTGEADQKAAQEEAAKKLVDLLHGKEVTFDASKGVVTGLLMDSKNKTITVTKDKTTEFKFGSPYKVTVDSELVMDGKGQQSVDLSLSMTGALDEQCVDVKVGGKRPPKPTFTITTKNGKEVESGAFEYG